ncbi:MAG: hypothetical protein WD075_12000 [Rhodospirillales bacterium]
MTETSLLTIAYIEGKPERAAKTLETLNVLDAAALIASLPMRTAALAVGRMSPWNAAQCIETIAADRAAGIIEQMLFQDAAAILRLASPACRENLFKDLPSGLSKAFENSLAFPRGTVGAHMNRLSPSMEATRTVADALKYARQKRRHKGEYLFITDGGRIYLGLVRISELLRHDGKVVLGDIMEKGVSPFLARASLTSIENAAQWDSHRVLPVVGRKGNFLGALSRKDWADARAEAYATAQPYENHTILQNMTVSYAVVLSALLKLVLRSDKGFATSEMRHDR